MPPITPPRSPAVSASRSAILLPALLLALLLPAPAPAARQKPALLEGKVQDEAGQPVAEASVVVTSPQKEDFRAEATTNRQGIFEVEIQGVTGACLIALSKDGHDPLITTLEVEAGKRQGFTFTLPATDSEASRKRRAVESYNAGVQAWNAGDREGARWNFENATELDPTLSEPLLALADFYMQDEEHAEALATAKAILALEPGQEKALRIQFEAAQRLGDEAATAAAAEALLGTTAAVDGAVAVFNEGVVASQKGDTETAWKRFEMAARLNPQLHQAWSAMASIAYNRQQYDQALAAADKLLALQPEDPHGLRLRYLTLTAQGQASKAAEAMAALQAVDAGAAAAELYDRADRLFRDNRMEEARAAAELVLELEPGHLGARYTLALCALNTGDPARARELLKAIVAEAPDSQKAADAREMLQHLN